MPSGLNQSQMLAPITSQAIDIRGRTQAQLAYTNAVAVTNFTVLTEGYYDLWATTNCYVAVGNTNAAINAVASNTGYFLGIMTPKTFKIRLGDGIGAIAATANGTLSFIRTG